MSPAHRFHPEFGYFCPVPGVRRKLRVALTCIVIGAIAGASGALMFRGAHDPEPSRVMVLTPVEESPAAVEIASAPGQGVPAQPIPGKAIPAQAIPSQTTAIPSAERPRAPEASGQAGCEQDAPASQTWAYLDGKCVPGRPRKGRAARPKTDGSATAAAPAGRDAMPAANSAGAAAAAGTPDRRPQVSQGGSPAPAVAATPPPAEQPAAAKKAQKPPRSQSAHDTTVGRDGRRRDDQLGARATDDRAASHSPFERGPFNFFFR